MKEYIEESFEERKKLIKKLCLIPAPSGYEEKRAEFCKKWMAQNICPDVHIDEALNVICEIKGEDENSVTVIMAHMDTVFPIDETLTFTEENGRFYCPGVTDDTANLINMFYAVKYYTQQGFKPKNTVLLVADSCEEGLGNLKGSKTIVKAYKDRIKLFITVDGTRYEKLITKAVGSHRYSVSVYTQGGHSYSAFGSKNAIACLASVIGSLYGIKVPEKEGNKTTYNVGLISGGTSVNTIASYANMLYEYRSDDKECLSIMEHLFFGIIDEYAKTGLDIRVEKVGDRPCGVASDQQVLQYYVERAKKIIKEVTGNDAYLASGSTDANSALSEGIPSVCITGAQGGNVHTHNEFLDLFALNQGLEILIRFFEVFFK